MPAINPSTLAEILKDPEKAKALLADADSVKALLDQHLPVLTKLYEQLKVSVTEPNMRAQVHEMAAKLAEVSERLPKAVADVYALDSENKSRAEALTKRARDVSAGLEKSLAKLKQPAARAASAAPPSALLPRIGARLRREVCDKYLGQRPAQEPTVPEVTLPEWLWSSSTSRSAESITESNPSSPSQESIPAKVTSHQSVESWLGGASVTTNEASLAGLPPPEVPTEDPSQARVTPDLFFQVSSISSNEPAGEPKAFGSFSSWFGAGSPLTGEQEAKVDPASLAREKFAAWKSKMTQKDEQ